MSVSTPIAHAQTAAPLAALLPARRGIAWKVTPAEYGIRANAAMSRITDGFRSLIVVEQAGVIEVYADRPDDFAVTPEVTVDAAGPDPVAALAAHVLRCTLPCSTPSAPPRPCAPVGTSRRSATVSTR